MVVMLASWREKRRGANTHEQASHTDPPTGPLLGMCCVFNLCPQRPADYVMDIFPLASRIARCHRCYCEKHTQQNTPLASRPKRVPAGKHGTDRSIDLSPPPSVSLLLFNLVLSMYAFGGAHAQVVGEFDFVSAYNKSGVLTTVYTPVGKAEQVRLG